eukprot:7513328-Pyramimonas_sp.AAC.1
MPCTQAQFDELLDRMRSYGHIAERAPSNIASTMRVSTRGTLVTATSGNVSSSAQHTWAAPEGEVHAALQGYFGPTGRMPTLIILCCP